MILETGKEDPPKLTPGDQEDKMKKLCKIATRRIKMLEILETIEALEAIQAAKTEQQINDLMFCEEFTSIKGMQA